MDETNELLTERRGNIGVLRFNRPERHNALSPQMLIQFWGLTAPRLSRTHEVDYRFQNDARWLPHSPNFTGAVAPRSSGSEVRPVSGAVSWNSASFLAPPWKS